MEQSLRDRIKLAGIRGDARVRWRPQHSRYHHHIDPQAIADHGPAAISDLLQKVLTKLTGKPHAQTPFKEDHSNWIRFSSNVLSLPVHTVERITYPNTPGEPFSHKLKESLEISIQDGYSITLRLLGNILQIPRIHTIASTHTWGEAGFYEIYEELGASKGKDPSTCQHEATLVVARCMAYAIAKIEDCHYPDELKHIQDCLLALHNGTVPVAYRKDGYLYTANWYTL